jgi:hypothetical protein
VCQKQIWTRLWRARRSTAGRAVYEHSWFSVRLIGMAVEVAAAQTRYEMKICRNLFHLISWV